MARAPRWKLSDGSEAHPQRFDPFDLVVLGLMGLGKTIGVAQEAVQGITGLAKGHANWRAERREFDSAVRDGIERLP